MLFRSIPGLLIVAGLGLGTLAAAQTPDEDRKAPVSRPQFTFCYCLDVKCVGNRFYHTVKGCGPSISEAKDAAYLAAQDYCGAAGIADIRDGVPTTACEMIEERTVAGIRQASAEEPEKNPWTVRGRLIYCDGSDGYEFDASGATYCEAQNKARRFLSLRRDRSRAARFTFTVVDGSSGCNCGR